MAAKSSRCCCPVSMSHGRRCLPTKRAKPSRIFASIIRNRRSAKSPSASASSRWCRRRLKRLPIWSRRRTMRSTTRNVAAAIVWSRILAPCCAPPPDRSAGFPFSPVRPPLALLEAPAQDARPIRTRHSDQDMPRTLFDKIWDFHRVGARADGRDLIYIDRHVLHELHAHHAFAQMDKQGRAVHRADLTFAVQDHTVATKPGRNDDTNPSGAAFLKAMRDGCRRHGIKLFDIGDPEQGISHVVAPELGIVLPGATHAVPDSHASTVGGVGALAFGCGTSELAHILTTQVMALKRPKAMRVRLEGRLGAHVSAKDVALRIIADLGVAGARGHAVEYAGSAVRAMPIEARMTLCNLNIEMGGRSGFVAPDDATFTWLA